MLNLTVTEYVTSTCTSPLLSLLSPSLKDYIQQWNVFSWLGCGLKLWYYWLTQLWKWVTDSMGSRKCLKKKQTDYLSTGSAKLNILFMQMSVHEENTRYSHKKKSLDYTQIHSRKPIPHVVVFDHHNHASQDLLQLSPKLLWPGHHYPLQHCRTYKSNKMFIQTYQEGRKQRFIIS